MLLFDDIRKSATGATQNVYRFLGIDSTFQPDVETPHAAGGVPASPVLEGLLTRSALSAALRPLVPARAANWVRRLRARTLRRPPALSPALRSQLTAPFRDDIQRTGDLIGRDLSHWI